jgi:hypothetical protein
VLCACHEDEEERQDNNNRYNNNEQNNNDDYQMSCDLFVWYSYGLTKSVLGSLIGAQIQGLFGYYILDAYVAPVTTSAYIATNGVVGPVAVTGIALVAVAIAGAIYLCVTSSNGLPAFLSLKCWPNVTCKDLKRPCELGLSICSKEQMLAFINSCRKCSPAPQEAAPRSVEMIREPEVVVNTTAFKSTPVANNIPVAELADKDTPQAVPVQAQATDAAASVTFRVVVA